MSLPASTPSRPARAAPRPSPANATARLSCQLARDVAGAMLDVPAEEIAGATRSRPVVCEARHVGMYLAHIVFQLPYQAVAEGFQRHRTTVSYAVRQIEDRRDDGRFDVLLTEHEERAEALRRQMAGDPA